MECKNCGKENVDGARFCEYCGEEFPVNSTEQVHTYCSKCGMMIPIGSKMCPSCGYGAEVNKETVSNSADRMIWKIILLISGIGGCIFSLYTILNDITTYDDYYGWSGYNYRSPLTGHETFMIGMLVVSIVLAIAGCVISSKEK